MTKNTLLSLTLSAAFIASPAYAGFEWIPPEGEKPPALQKPQEVITPEPIQIVVEEEHMSEPKPAMHHIAVVPVEEEQADISEYTDEPMPIMEAETTEVVETETEEVEETSETVAVVAEEETIEEDVAVINYEEELPKQSYPDAYGFGKEMPLALALRQIVPASYAFSFDPMVDIATRVSWQGGKPWNEVLTHALKNEQLSAVVFDDMVLVQPGPKVEMAVAELESDAPEATAETVALTETQPDYFSIQKAWSAETGQTLKSVLSNWSDDIGVELHWENVYDFPIKSEWTHNGNYVHAVDNILTAFENETPKPTGRLHPNAPDGPAVLVVDVE